MNTQIYDRMETFILSEVDYALTNGYTRRARRFMRRRLHKELKELDTLNNLDIDTLSELKDSYDPFDLSLKIDKKTYVWLLVLYVSSLFTFYAWISQNLFNFIEINHTIVGQTYYSDGQPYGNETNTNDCLD